MASNKELEAKIQALQHMLEGHGIRLPTETAETPEERADYIAHGSAEHATFLGLVEVKNGEDTTALTYASKGVTWRLEDEVTAFMHYPDPKQVAALVLRQKVSSFETKPTVPADAPPMGRPGI